MRLHPPTTVLFILAAGLAAITVANPHEVQSNPDPRCAVLRRYIDIVVLDKDAFEGQKPIVVSQDRPYSMGSVGEFLNGPNAPYSAKTHPLLPLYLELENRKDARVSDACPSLLKGLNRFRWETAADRAVLHRGKAGEWDAIYFAVSLPAISKDERQAIFDVSFGYASLSAYGLSVLMQKDAAGRWGIVSQDRTWVS